MKSTLGRPGTLLGNLKGLGLIVVMGVVHAQAQAQGISVWGGTMNGYPPSTFFKYPLTEVASGDAGGLFGLSVDGSLYDLSNELRFLPMKPPILTDGVQIAGALLHLLVLKKDGTVVAFGRNLYGEATVPAGLKDVVQVFAGGYHSLALLKNGTLKGWGRPYDSNPRPTELKNVVQAALGGNHGLALTRDGTVVAWGDNQYGQCAVPSDLGPVTQVAAGNDHSLALRRDGTVAAWGRNMYGETVVPPGLNGVVQIAAVQQRSLALKEDGSVVVWGLSGMQAPSNLGTSVKVGSAGQYFYALGPVNVCFSSGLDVDGTARGTLVLPVAPGVGGADVQLTTDKAGVVVPAKVHVEAGAHQATFKVSAKAKVRDYTAVITAGYRGGSASASLPVYGTSPKLTLSLDRVVGGGNVPVTATIRLGKVSDQPTVLRLKSSDPCVQLPPSITVPAGEQRLTFDLKHAFVTDKSKNVKITVYDGADDVAAQYLTVFPYVPQLSIRNIEGGGYRAQGQKGYVSMFGGGYALPKTVFSVTSDHPELVKLPSTVTIPKGQAYVEVLLETEEVARNTAVKVTIRSGSAKWTEEFTLLTKPKIANVSFPASLCGNQNVTGSVSLVATRSSNEQVLLQSGGSAISLPQEIWMSSSLSGSFFAAIADVDTVTKVSLSARSGRSIVSKEITIRPNGILSMTLSTSKVKGGSVVEGSFKLIGKVATEAKAEISTSDPLVAQTPASITVKPGSRDGHFTIATSPVTKETVVKIKVRRKGAVKIATLTLTP